MPEGLPRIWGYSLEFAGEQILELPGGAQFLSVVAEQGAPKLYAIVSPGARSQRVRVLIWGTGYVCMPPPTARFVGSVRFPDKAGVWHVFVDGFAPYLKEFPA